MILKSLCLISWTVSKLVLFWFIYKTCSEYKKEMEKKKSVKKSKPSDVRLNCDFEVLLIMLLPVC